MIQLGRLSEGTCFTIGARTATLISKNDAEAKVLILSGDGEGKTIGWSLGTLVDAVVPMVLKVADDNLVCEVCGRACKSADGLRLHRYNRHSQRG